MGQPDENFDGKIDGQPRCLGCNKINDGATCTGDTARPEEGDISVCAYCGAVTKYGAGCKTFEPITEDEFASITSDMDTMRSLTLAGIVIRHVKSERAMLN